MGNLEEQLDKQEEVIRNYLLDWLDETAILEIDERILTEPEFYDNVLLIEQEMLEDLVAGRLDPKEQAQARQIYQLPGNREKLDFAVNLYQAAERYHHQESAAQIKAEQVQTTDNSRREKFLGWFNCPRLIAAGSFLVIVGVVLGWHFFLSKRAVSERELARLNQARPNLVNNEKLRELKLPSDSVRTSDLMPKIIISASDEIIIFQLSVINDSSETYEATFQDDQGNELFLVSGLKLQNIEGANYVYVLAPASFFHSGDFQINLQGRSVMGSLTKAGNFTFRVSQP